MSGSARSLDFMARHGIKGVISATAEQFVERWLRDYQAAAGRHGRNLQLGEDVILGFRMCLDDSEARAMDRARPYFEEHAKFMAPLGMLRYSEEQVRAVAARQAQSPTMATLDNGVAQSQLALRPAGAHRRLSERGRGALPRIGAHHDRVGAGNAARADDRAAHALRPGGHAGVSVAVL